MKISTCIDSVAKKTGEERALELIAEAGFDCWDFSMFTMNRYSYADKTLSPSDHPLGGDDWRAFAKHLGEVGRSLGLTCNQSHAPFPAFAEGQMAYLHRAIETTALAGGKICIIHPDNYKGAEENAVMYRELLPTAHKFGVKIATENMWNWNYETKEAAPAACSHHDDFLAHIEAVNDPYLVACVDIGHADMRGLSTDPYTMIKTLGRHVAALHVHDNDKHRDSHELPYTMDIDFDAVARALAEIDYQGEITLEACYYRKDATAEEQPERLAAMAAAARRLADAVEGYKAK